MWYAVHLYRACPIRQQSLPLLASKFCLADFAYVNICNGTYNSMLDNDRQLCTLKLLHLHVHDFAPLRWCFNGATAKRDYYASPCHT